MKRILVDSGWLYAMFDERDGYHVRANESYLAIRTHRFVLAWPIMYETLRTKMVRNGGALGRFQTFLKSHSVDFIDDTPFRGVLLESSFDTVRSMSMVDRLLRQVIDDPRVRIDAVATFNLRDFADICARHRLEVVGPAQD